MEPIKPIRTERDHEEALTLIERLMDAEPDTPEGDMLEVLAMLVDAYEAKHQPIEAPDPIAAIEHRMEALGLSRKDLEPLIGGSGRVSEVLGRKRGLSIDMIRRLRAGLQIPAEVLIQPYQIADKARDRRTASKRKADVA